MAAGVGISYVFDPKVAIASATAFAVSELADWAVYTFTRRPFSERILYSSAVGTPIDSIVFLGMIGFLSFAAVAAMTVSKLLGALIVWWLIRRREVVPRA